MRHTNILEYRNIIKIKCIKNIFSTVLKFMPKTQESNETSYNY